MKKVFGYIRRSTESENLSLIVQEKSIRAYAESQGWEIAGVFCDSAESGKNLTRPGFNKMLQQLSPVINLVLVMKQDRISRNLKDILILIEDVLDPRRTQLKVSQKASIQAPQKGD